MLSTAKSSSSVPDRGSFGLGHHLVLRGIGNGAAGSDSREPRAPPAHAAPVHSIAMQVRAAAPAGGGDAFREHLQHGVEITPL
jgi:hypothetical protein